MTNELKETITKAGLILTTISVAGTGGYFVSESLVDTTPIEVIVEKPVFNYWGEEGALIVELWNAMLDDKKLNCEIEPDCTITNGKAGVTYEGIHKNQLPRKLNEELLNYKIKVEKIK